MLLSTLFFSVVSVGFEYESCPDLILWEKRTAVLQGYEITASKLGGWTIDKHHALNIQSGESTHCSYSRFLFSNFLKLFLLNLFLFKRYFTKKYPKFLLY